MIAQHIEGYTVILHQVLSSDSIGHGIGDAGTALVAGTHCQNGGVGRTGANDQTAGIILLDPAVGDLLIPTEMGSGIALGEAGGGHDVGLVGKFDGFYRNTIFRAQIHDLLSLPGRPGSFRIVNALAVSEGDQQLAANRLDEVQQTQPLLLLQHILEALGNHAGLILAVKIIVGLVCPGAGDTDPDRAEGLSQIDKLFIFGIDGVIPLLELAQVSHAGQRRNLFSASHLSGSIRHPEGAAGNLGHFHVVGHEPLIYGVQLLHFRRI